jgi:hypothetical protein
MNSNEDINVPEYLEWCARLNLKPCFVLEYLAGLKFAEPNELPYLDENDLIRLHDKYKKRVCRSLVEVISGSHGTR